MSIRIKCPNCGKVLNLNFKQKSTADLNKLKIKCPVCEISSPFSSYRNMDEGEYPNFDDTISHNSANKDNTNLNNYSEDTETKHDGRTAVNLSYSKAIGMLKVSKSVNAFKLREGRNVIGRKASSSKADIQIPTNAEQMRISREHFVINVKKLKSGNYIHTLSLYKEDINDTFYKSTKLKFGDSFFLQNGDIIKLPDGISVEFIENDEGLTLK